MATSRVNPPQRPTNQLPASNETYIGKLDRSQLSKIRETIMSRIFIDNEGDVLHWLGTEPFCHCGTGCRSTIQPICVVPLHQCNTSPVLVVVPFRCACGEARVGCVEGGELRRGAHTTPKGGLTFSAVRQFQNFCSGVGRATCP